MSQWSYAERAGPGLWNRRACICSLALAWERPGHPGQTFKGTPATAPHLCTKQPPHGCCAESSDVPPEPACAECGTHEAHTRDTHGVCPPTSQREPRGSELHVTGSGQGEQPDTRARLLKVACPGEVRTQSSCPRAQAPRLQLGLGPV